ncbi:hypothetical protein [Candidatus Arsenophonus triatominarum]|uniref:hypothetical protein n=1 Tax=Candidatus Arsenophonus triatominarum TaxID=57911 RepID=UPI000940A9C5|nr:hypothetical protein [Candidatus Arsenophonus triatominarum]
MAGTLPTPLSMVGWMGEPKGSPFTLSGSTNPIQSATRSQFQIWRLDFCFSCLDEGMLMYEYVLDITNKNNRIFIMKNPEKMGFCKQIS